MTAAGSTPGADRRRARIDAGRGIERRALIDKNACAG
jgi:hypothetical protein